MAYATIGVPYDPTTANPAFYLAMDKIRALHFNVSLLDCRYFNEVHLSQLITQNCSVIDGLLIPGSPEDIPPHVYNERQKTHKYKVAKSDHLAKYEIAMIRQANAQGIPVLGICAGANVLNVAYGGKIDQDISESTSNMEKVPHDIEPRQGALAHSVTIKQGTHLHDILSATELNQKDLDIRVNSWHHSANCLVPQTLKVNARAKDGVIEGIEMAFPGNPNCLGIQFHPEYLNSKTNPKEYPRQIRLLKAFHTSCLQKKRKKDMHQQLKALKLEESTLVQYQTKRENMTSGKLETKVSKCGSVKGPDLKI